MNIFGVVYPQTEFGSDPYAIRDYAQTAEGLGYSYILAYDHVLGANPDRPGGFRGPYTYQDSFFEPFTLFSYLAGITEKIGFTTSIIILPQRQTALVAKQAATLDILSHGRLRLGVGLGWNKVEYEALDENFHNRGRRIEEQVEILRLLWTKPLVTYRGRWHNIPDAGLNPLPIQQPIPIWFGGHAEPVLRRVARIGDGWMPTYRSAEEAKKSLAKLDRFLQEEYRDPSSVGIEARLPYGEGNPVVWQTQVDEWKAMRATHFSINTMSCGFYTPNEHIDAIKTFANSFGLG
ncbi:MAG: LLM class F420-dependent oxidoreductase [Anaerolineales bacterium]|nr:MAG: LLM class F420-dependent oxidoreductase [Anaerolineales bacterium]